MDGILTAVNIVRLFSDHQARSTTVDFFLDFSKFFIDPEELP